MSPNAADWSIRPVARGEAAAWRELRAEMLKNHPIAFSSAYEDFILQPLEVVAARIPEPGGGDVLLGVYRGGELCGSAGFARESGRKSEHKGVMWGIYLRPALRGTGAGEALVAAVVAHARERVALLFCAVTTQNVGARALYERLGFRVYGVEPRALRWGGRDYDEALLVLELAGARERWRTVAVPRKSPRGSPRRRT